MSTASSLFSWIGRSIGLGPTFRRFWVSWAGNETASGESVTPESVLKLSAFNRGVRIWAETIATLPIDVFKVGADGRGKLVTDPADQYRVVLKLSPNQDQTPVEFWEGIVGCMFLAGDGMARKIFVGGRLVAMNQMDPTRTTTVRDPATGKLTYRFVDGKGNIVVLQPEDVFHLKGFGFGGDRGMSIVQFGAQTFGSSLAADKVAAKMFKSGLTSSGFLETGQVLNEPDRDRLTKVLSDYTGSDNTGKLMILEGGMKYTPISMSAADAQLLQARGFNIEEIARWLSLPPVLLGHAGAGSTMWGTGVEQIIRAWYTLGLRALLHRIELAIHKRVIAPEDQGRYYVRFNVEGLLRGDSAARANLYSVFVQNGIMTRAEVRALEDLDPLEQKGVDVLTAQMNLTPIDKLGEEPNKGGTGNGDAMFKEKIKNWLGIDSSITAQDLFDIRSAISELKAQRQQPTVIDQPPRPALQDRRREGSRDLRDR